MRYERRLVKISVFERGWVTSSFQGEGGSSTKDFWRQKTRFPGLSRGVVCVILRLAVLIPYWRVTHTQTDGHTMMAITRAARVKYAMSRSINCLC